MYLGTFDFDAGCSSGNRVVLTNQSSGHGIVTADAVRFGETFERLSPAVTTDDGSLGYHGNAVDYIKEKVPEFDRYYACGPMPMLKGMAAAFKGGQLSLEARMGCGFGACMGCSVETVYGPKRVCREGPVFWSEEVIFGDR